MHCLVNIIKRDSKLKSLFFNTTLKCLKMQDSIRFSVDLDERNKKAIHYSLKDNLCTDFTVMILIDS